MAILVNWLLSTLAIIASAYLLSGVHVAGFGTALVVALVLGIINAVLKPLFILLTLPINILTLGLFTLVINSVLILITTNLVPGFQVDGFWWALAFSLVLSLVHSILFKIFR